jgi:hypothetical protein
MPCSSLKVNGCFRRTCHLHSDGWGISQEGNQHEAGSKQSHSVDFQRTTGRYIPEKRTLQILWHVDPFLGNDSLGAISRRRMRRQQSDNFRCYAARYKYNSRGRGVFYVVRMYPLLGNGCVFYGPPRNCINGTEPNQIRNENENGASPWQSRKKGSAKDWLWVIVLDYDYE